ncbi:MAG: DUF1858 domain-containing protein [bacterium]
MTRDCKIDLETSVADIMAHSPEIVPVFLRFRLKCVGCAIAPFHRITEACALHGADEAAFRAAVVKVLGRSRNQSDELLRLGDNDPPPPA